ncbi:Uncharacterised protein [Providencia alcalifaciens]|nr:Uncharacterised protein [Providencia alcalifaciens]
MGGVFSKTKLNSAELSHVVLTNLFSVFVKLDFIGMMDHDKFIPKLFLGLNMFGISDNRISDGTN